MVIRHDDLIDLCEENEELMDTFASLLSEVRLAHSNYITIMENLPKNFSDFAIEGYKALYQGIVIRLWNIIDVIEEKLGCSMFNEELCDEKKYAELLNYNGWLMYPLLDDPRRHLFDAMRRKRKPA